VQSIRILSEHLTPPNKLLGIDFGMRYLGVSLSDGSNLVAAPFRTFDEKSASKAFGFGPDSLSSIIDAHRVQALVVGVPFTSGGGEDEACARVRRFVAELHANRVTDRPIFLWVFPFSLL
jgi:putative transcription antitermination factor YqgF